MKIEVTQTQMNLILAAVEHGFREGERGKNLEAALSGVFELYAVAPVENLNDMIGRITPENRHPETLT